MIQRIQTLYLLIVTVLIAVMFFLPSAWFIGGNDSFSLYAFDFRGADGEPLQSAVYLGVMLVLACAVPFVTIFCYKRRMLQLRLCAVEIVLLVGAEALLGAYYYLGRRVVGILPYHAQGFKPACVLPLVCLLFVWLAARAIFRDELLVKSLDRIR